MSGSHSSLKHTREWLRDWLKEGPRGERMIRQGYLDQKRNVKCLMSIRRHQRRVPTWCDLGEYLQSVRLIGRVVRGFDDSTS